MEFRHTTVSAKFRLTLWLTLMVLTLAAVVLGFVILFNESSTLDDPAERLVKMVERNASRVEFDNGRFDWEDLSAYRRGVYCCFYNQQGELLLAALPEDVDPAGLDFQANIVRTVRLGEQDYFLYDSYVDMDVTGLWIRGLVATGDSSGLMHAITMITLTLLPLLLLVALGGGWLIAWDTFRPMEQILAAANSISNGEDLTARIRLKRASSEMLRLADAFNRMFERLERSFRAQQQFASDASHELRTPITVILAECDRAQRKNLSPEATRESLDVIADQGRKMSDLVQQLLSLTRMERGGDAYPLREGDLSLFVASCCEEFIPAADRGIRLSTDIAPGVTARFHPALYSRIIQNLLENAYKYGREGGWIHLRLQQENGKAVLTVEDNGAGIPPEDQDKIWGRFWQGSSGREQENGTGLGLAMVKEIAEFHGGRAAVESVPGQGSRFTVTI